MTGERGDTSHHRATRRAFLGGVTAGAVAAILAACGGGSTATQTPGPVINPPPGSAGTVVSGLAAAATNAAARLGAPATTPATATVIPTDTPVPPATATATRRPPSATPTRAPATPTPRPPNTATPIPNSPTPAPSPIRAVYALTNQESGNGIVVFNRAADGRLTQVGIAATGGRGAGNLPDNEGLGSQGGLAFSRDGRLLFAVNGGSGDISVFAVQESGLTPVDRVSSNGPRPISVTSYGNLVYVLNNNRQSAGGGNITGFTIGANNHLTPLTGSTRPLSSDKGVDAGQVLFSPNGDLLVVTEKATNRLVTYTVASSGLTAGPIPNAAGGETPFALAFASANLFVTADANRDAPGKGTVSSYGVGGQGSARVVSNAVPNGQTAACWIAATGDGRYAYAVNGGGTTVSGYRVGQDGRIALLNANGVTGQVGKGPRDIALSADSRFLYVLNTLSGTITSFAVQADGGLQPLGDFGKVPIPGANGLVAR
jgi:6-phosphogluconolactonase